jgi:glycosyltransferase involved in cell wall biosynthesis
MKVLTVARWYPSHDSPGSGSFVSDMVRATVELGVEARVASFDRVRVPRTLTREGRSHAAAVYRTLASPESLFLTPPSLGAPGVAVARIPVIYSTGNEVTEALIDDHAYALRPFVRALCGTWRPDVIHAHTGLPDGIVAAEIGRELGIPVIVTEHASTIEAALASPIALARYRTLLEPDIRLLAVSPSTADRLAGLLGVESDRIKVLANPIFEASFPLAGPAGRRPDELLYAGSLAPHKGIDVLLRALGLMRTARPSLRLRIIGAEITAGEREPLENLTAELGLSDVVAFEGWANRERIASAMARASVLVHPSPSETFGVVAAEAILSGLPVASRRSGGVPWIIDLSGGFGAVATGDDDAAFASAIMTLLDRPPAVSAAVARSRLVDAVGSSAIAADALTLYRSVAGRGVGVSESDLTAVAHARPERSGGVPSVLAARDRGHAAKTVAKFPEGLRRHLVLVASRPGPRAVTTTEQINNAMHPGRFVEADPVPARRRGWGPLARVQRAVQRPQPTVDDVLASAILHVASGVRGGDEPIEVVALDAQAAAIVARLDPTKVRLAPGSRRWLADLWDVQRVRGQSAADDDAADVAPQLGVGHPTAVDNNPHVG